MEENSPLENDFELHEAFGIILSIESFSNYINEIIELIYTNTLDEKSLEEIFERNQIKRIEDIKEELLDVLIVYINLVLNDHVISENELNNLQHLKLTFKIHEGDFYKYRYDEIGEVLKRQFIRMYRNDEKIDAKEALHNVSLQKLFDLSYDQLQEFQKDEIFAALERGADIIDLDTAIKLPKDFNTASDALSRRIAPNVRDLVWNRDGGKCVDCGSNIGLEFDHIIPLSKGGSNTYRNLQLLCEKCNRKKSNKIG